jgi:signal transduction histidine kinase
MGVMLMIIYLYIFPKLNHRITQLKSILTQSQTQVKSLLEGTNYIFFILGKDLSLLQFNRATANYAADTFGQSLNLGDNLLHFIPEEEQEAFLSLIQKTLSGERCFFDLKLKEKYRGTVWYFVQFLPVYTADSAQVEAISVSVVDITVRKKSETKVKLQNIELRTANQKLADMIKEKDLLMGVVAHDIRSPLNRIRSLVDLLQDSGSLNEKQQEYITLINKVADEGSKLIYNLLEINRLEQKDYELELSIIDLSSFVKEVVNFQQKIADDKFIQIVLQNELPSNFTFRTDLQALRRILENLLSNAIKFSYNHSKIYISLMEDANKLIIQIRDQGQGISVEDQKKLFQKFNRLSSRPTGGESSTGLGLSIVKSLVEKMQGEILVNSQLGQGAEFIVTFPTNNQKLALTA